MYQQFIQAIKWNTAGIVVYKIMLFIHQTFLYRAIPQTKYGIVETLFSTIYFLIPVSNFGFDYTILSFFQKKRSPKESNFIAWQYFYRICTILTIIAIAVWLRLHLELTTALPSDVFTAAAIIFFFENIKHSLRIHAHIFNLNKKIAFFENIHLIGYIFTIWGYFFWYQSIPMTLLFLPLAAASMVETIFVAMVLYRSYKKLPLEIAHNKEKSHARFFKESLFNYINQLAKAFYSPNFLIIFLALMLGFEKTGYIKYITNIIIFLYAIFHRSIHVSAGALFASLSTMPQELIKKAFNNITNYYLQLLAIISIYFSALLYIHAQKQSIFTSAESFSMHSIIITFCLISFLEYGTLTYETLFISQKRGRFLAAINSVHIFGALLFLGISYFFPHPGLLIGLCLLKLATTSFIMVQAYKIWDVSIKVSINQTTLLIHGVIALCLVSYFL